MPLRFAPRVLYLVVFSVLDFARQRYSSCKSFADRRRICFRSGLRWLSLAKHRKVQVASVDGPSVWGQGNEVPGSSVSSESFQQVESSFHLDSSSRAMRALVDAANKAPFFTDSSADYLMVYAASCPVNSDVLVFDVGGNKGYSLPRYGMLWGNLDVAMVRHHIKDLQARTHFYRESRLKKLHVFEPTASAMKVLERLKHRLPFFDNIELHQLGVGEKDASAVFRTPYNNTGDEGASMGRIPGLPQEGPIENVRVVSLDNWYDSQYPDGSPPIVYVKIDVEGFDAYVVRGMHKLLKQKKVRAFEFEVANSWVDGRTPEKQQVKPLLLWLENELEYKCYWLKQFQSRVLFLPIASGLGPYEIGDDRSNAFCIDKRLSCVARLEAVAGLRSFRTFEDERIARDRAQRGTLSYFAKVLDPHLQEVVTEGNKAPFFTDSSADYLLAYAAACPTGGTVFDVGGNKGYSLPRYGMLWSNLDVEMVRHNVKDLQEKTHFYRGANNFELHVFEPTQSAMDVLSRLKERIPYFANIHLHHLGVGETNGEATFQTPYVNVGDEGASMGKIPGLPQKGPRETVRVVSLDTWYEENKPKGPIAFVKIDVEGFDAYVVRGMKTLLARRQIKAFEFEVAPSWTDGRTPEIQRVEPLLEFISRLGYQCYWLKAYRGRVLFMPIAKRYGSLDIKDARSNAFCILSSLPCVDRLEKLVGVSSFHDLSEIEMSSGASLPESQ